MAIFVKPAEQSIKLLLNYSSLDVMNALFHPISANDLKYTLWIENHLDLSL